MRFFKINNDEQDSAILQAFVCWFEDQLDKGILNEPTVQFYVSSVEHCLAGLLVITREGDNWMFKLTQLGREEAEEIEELAREGV